MDEETDALWIASIFIKANVKLTFKSTLDFEFKKI
jgi:hypothetical protein